MPPRSSRRRSPRWRGRIHLGAFLVSIPAGLALVLLSQGVSAHVGAAIFAASLAGLFGISAIYHTGNWAPHVRARLRRMDHAMIFVLIAGSYTPITLLALQPAWGISLLAIVWTVAVVGVTLALARFGALHRVGGYLYIGMGWIVVIALPAVRARRSARPSCCSCSPAACSTRSGRSGCASTGRSPPAGVRVPRGLARDDGGRGGLPLHARRHARPRLTDPAAPLGARAAEVQPSDVGMSVAELLSDVLGDDVARGVPRLRRVDLRAGRRPHHDRRALARCAAPHRDRARRARVRPRLRRRRARGRRRHLRRDGGGQLHRGAAARTAPDRGRGQARRLEGPEAARHPRRRKRASTAVATPRDRDAAAIAHHYDVSNDFYRMVLGPSLTYSCAVWHDDTDHARGRAGEQARAHLPQARPRNRACGSSTSDAAGAACCSTRPSTTASHAVGVTLSRPQADLARKRVAERGLGDRVEVRYADFRDVDDGPYDAISSIGMFEHVGLSELDGYFARCHSLLRPEGRLLNHGISRPAPRGQEAPSPVGSRRSWAAASPSATCSPTASCTRSATSSPRSSAPGSRPATWRACASTTR